MPVIKILPHPEYCPSGAEINAPAGTSICEALLENHINIEHACDMSCACTTCHVIVRAGIDSLNEAEEEEEDLLDRAWGWNPSRASRARRSSRRKTWWWRFPNIPSTMPRKTTEMHRAHWQRRMNAQRRAARAPREA